MPRRDRGRDRDGERAASEQAGRERSASASAARPAVGPAESLLGELEAAIMAHCWAAAEVAGALDGAPQTVAQVQQAFAVAGRRAAYTTVMTVMGRLAEKGILKRSESLGRSGPGSSYRYWPAQSRAEFITAASRERVSALIATFGDVALAQFADALSTLDPERLAALARLAHESQDLQAAAPQAPSAPSELHLGQGQDRGTTSGGGHAPNAARGEGHP